jgi:hypothetical protein
MAVAKYHYTCIGKLPACGTLIISGVTKNMHYSNSTMPHHYLTFYRQRMDDILAFNIPLHSYYWRNGLQLREHRKGREITSMDNQVDPIEKCPDRIGKAEMWDMGIRDNTYAVLCR